MPLATPTIGGSELNAAATPGSVHPLVLLWSDDLDATVAALSAAGGRISVPIHDFPGGRRCQFVDPAGNELGIWTGA